MKRPIQLLSIGIFSFSICNLAFGENTTSAGIAGQMIDASRAGVPDTLVTVINAGTNVEDTFSVSDLALARYEVRIEAQGFHAAIIAPFKLRIGDVVRRLIELRIGAVSESVISAGYELSFGTGKRYLNGSSLSSLPVGGWQVHRIFSLTGPFVCSCLSYIPQWANAVKPGFGAASDPTPNGWYDPSAFALPPIGFQGTAPRTTAGAFNSGYGSLVEIESGDDFR